MFTFVSTILFTVLFLMWRKSDWFNFTIKLGLILMAGWGFYLLVNNSGAF
jgi:hypothetical protein